jgi:hypothetical protein
MTVPIQIINSLASFDSADECGRINYCCFMQYLDWVENAAPKALPSHERVSKIIIILITTKTLSSTTSELNITVRHEMART